MIFVGIFRFYWKSFQKGYKAGECCGCMDEKDREILRELVLDGRATVKEIAKRVELPTTTAYNRFKKMEGDMFEVHASLNRQKLGYGLDAYVLVSVDSADGDVDQRKLAKQMTRLPGVLSASVVTGSKDIVVKATMRSVKELSELLLSKLRGLQGVTTTETFVIMEEERSSETKLL